MKKGLFLICVVLSLISCQSDPPEAKFLYETSSSTGVGVGWCCRVPGTSCYGKGQGFSSYFSSKMRSYVENDNLKGYFLENDWQSTFPELTQDIVNTIINSNLKGAILNDKLFIILKDRNGNYEASNVLIAFKFADSPDCDKWFNS